MSPLEKPERPEPQGTLILSQDIKPQWLNVLRRLQQVAKSQQGLAVITIAVFVNQDGTPISWTSPQLTCLEPKSAQDEFLEFLKAL